MEAAQGERRSALKMTLDRAAVAQSAWTPARRRLTFDQWRKAGRRLATLDNALQWMIGDWLNFGRRAYGEKYREAVEITDYELHTLHQLAWVAGTFEPHRRRATLSWSHHKEVAALEPPQQNLWLERAESKRWSCMRLRSELRLAQNLGPGRDFRNGSSEGARGGSLPAAPRPESAPHAPPAPSSDRRPHRVTFALRRRAGTREEAQEAAEKVVRAALELGFELAGKPQFRS